MRSLSARLPCVRFAEKARALRGGRERRRVEASIAIEGKILQALILNALGDGCATGMRSCKKQSPPQICCSSHTMMMLLMTMR